MTLLVDTAVVPAGERVEFWSESSRRAYHPVLIRASGPFFARLWSFELGPLSVYRIAASANTMIRTPRLIADGDPECLNVETILSGRVNAAQDGRNGVARAGDIISYETSHAAVMRADEPFESVVVRVPRRLLGSHADAICAATAVPISGRRAAATFLGRLPARLDAGGVAADEVSKTVTCVLELVRGLYAGADRVNAPARLRTRAEILLGVESYIDANLGDADLEPERIARASFISTRYLHKLFESEGTSVGQWIRSSRLERCRRDLADPALSHQTILSIATRWGLPGAQNFSRVFRAAYGCSPNEFRRAARTAG
jgi:AraC-like DNA-binding protein